MKTLLHKMVAAIGLALAAQASAAGGALPLAGDKLYALPPEPLVRQVLNALPQLRLGSLGQELAATEKTRLEAGPHEWTVKGGAGQRRVTDGQRYREQELGVERTLRWFGKADQDRAIGQQGISLADAQKADAWHEAGRTLMQDWYGALRAQAAVQRLSEEHALVERLKTVAEKRVKAGERPGLELLQAETEVRRSQAQLEQARQDAAQALALLRITYQQLPEPDASALPEPQGQQEDAASLVGHITADNHEFELAQVEAEWYRLKARRAASERMPDPTLAMRMTREFAGQEKTVGLVLSIPLPGAGRSAEASSAAVRARMAEEKVGQVRNKIELDAQRAVAEQRHSYQIWHSLRDVAEQSRRQALLSERAYQAGEASLSDALLSRRQAVSAVLAAQTAQINALAASARVQLDSHALWSFD